LGLNVGDGLKLHVESVPHFGNDGFERGKALSR